MTGLVFDRKDVFSWSNAESVEPYIGKAGYFSDNFDLNLSGWATGVLKNVCPNNPVNAIFGNGDYRFKYGLFLPVDKVKEVEEVKEVKIIEKKWRAYKNLKEFDYKVGDIIRLRRKWDRESEYLYLITGFMHLNNIVCINGESYTFEYLFDQYEIFKSNVCLHFGAWFPFGVEE